MKTIYRISLYLFLHFISFTCLSQNIVEFYHDLAGNRSLRWITVTKVADTSFKSHPASIDNCSSENDLNEVISKIKVYPNPTYGLINIDVPESTNIEYMLFDQQSKVIKSGSIESQHSIIDIYDCEKGIYLLKIIYQQTTSSYKIIKT